MLMFIVLSVPVLFVLGQVFADILSAGSHHRGAWRASGMQPVPIPVAVEPRCLARPCSRTAT
jgi:hypothetical protein